MYKSVTQEYASQPIAHLEQVKSLHEQLSDYKTKYEKLWNDIEVLKEANKQFQEK